MAKTSHPVLTEKLNEARRPCCGKCFAFGFWKRIAGGEGKQPHERENHAAAFLAGSKWKLTPHRRHHHTHVATWKWGQFAGKLSCQLKEEDCLLCFFWISRPRTVKSQQTAELTIRNLTLKFSLWLDEIIKTKLQRQNYALVSFFSSLAVSDKPWELWIQDWNLWCDGWHFLYFSSRGYICGNLAHNTSISNTQNYKLNTTIWPYFSPCTAM